MKNIFNKFKKFICDNKYSIIVMSIYTLIGIRLLFIHEPWRDEAQAWLISRDLSFIGIFKQMYYEGHPCLWHLILAPFSKLGFPYFTVNIISYVITWFTALLILKKAPFNKIAKIIIIFSLPFMYNYSVIARNYCLIPLAFALIAINYKNRNEKPIRYTLSILLLAWTHVVMSGTAGILYLLFFWERFITNRKSNNKSDYKINFICLIVATIGLLLYVIPIGLGASSCNLINTEVRTDYFYILKYISKLIFYKTDTSYLILLGGLLIIFLIYELIYYRKNLLILLVTFIYHIFVYYNVYYLSTQRSEIYIFLFMFIIWIQKYEKDFSNNLKKILNTIIPIVMLILLCKYNSTNKYSIINDIDYTYSEAKNTGTYIQENIKNNSIIITPDIPQTSSVIPFVDKNKNISFFGLNSNEYFTYVTWTYPNDIYDEKYLKNIINTKFKNKNNLYVLCGNTECLNYQNLIQEGFLTPIYNTDFSTVEAYSLYKVNKKNR